MGWAGSASLGPVSPGQWAHQGASVLPKAECSYPQLASSREKRGALKGRLTGQFPGFWVEEGTVPQCSYALGSGVDTSRVCRYLHIKEETQMWGYRDLWWSFSVPCCQQVWLEFKCSRTWPYPFWTLLSLCPLPLSHIPPQGTSYLKHSHLLAFANTSVLLENLAFPLMILICWKTVKSSSPPGSLFWLLQYTMISCFSKFHSRCILCFILCFISISSPPHPQLWMVSSPRAEIESYF